MPFDSTPAQADALSTPALPALSLPDRPSELIEPALTDLRKCEAQPQVYRINMSSWHYSESIDKSIPAPAKRCEVCAAGAIMAQTLRVPPGESRDPDNFPPNIKRKLDAINYFRLGVISQGLQAMGIPVPFAFKLKDAYIPSYQINPEGFYRNLAVIAKRLRTYGL